MEIIYNEYNYFSIKNNKKLRICFINNLKKMNHMGKEQWLVKKLEIWFSVVFYCKKSK